MKRLPILLIGLIALGIVVFGATQLRGQAQPQYSADLIAALSGGDNQGFAKATTVREFVFPDDHGAHPEFQTEWWYNTGNLATADGRRFGIHFTIFRRALLPTAQESESDWRTNQVYFADLAVADIAANRFYWKERFSRGGDLGLAGTELDPNLRIWIEDWEILGANEDATVMRLLGAEGPIAIDLTAREVKAPVLHGDRGLSAKSPEPGNASYYYSLTRRETTGTITINGEVFEVSGTTWLDHEWSTSVLSEDAEGWDWFSLQLDNNREIMLYQIRKQDGSVEITSDGTIVEPDGSTHYLRLEDYTITPTGSWTSPHTGATYPSGWELSINAPTGKIELTVTPLMQDQELNTATAYWEGASRVEGTDNGVPVGGYGYVELTGYNIRGERERDPDEPLTRQGQ
jgi:predicted secreted hydrolase